MRFKIVDKDGVTQIVEAQSIVLDDGSLLGGINGAGFVDNPPYGSFEYQDATYLYQCEFVAGPTAARSNPAHRVIRTTLADNTVIPAGVGGYDHAATDIATVQLLTYTLGA